MRLLTILFLAILLAAAEPASAQPDPEDILLKNYRPVSLHKTQGAPVMRARHAAIDVHSHAYAETPEDLDRWVAHMDSVHVERTVILTGAVGARFDSLMQLYSRYPDRFELWCGLDLRDSDAPDFAERAIAELERCKAVGGLGVGELSDKGRGLRSGGVQTDGLHLDDPRLRPVLRRAGELGIPINIHVADPIWMYQSMDSTNDGMMNALTWRLDNQEGIVDHEGMIRILENAVRDNPQTTFIACHFANLSFDLDRLGRLLDTYPNLYADISARFAETSVIPRTARKFYERYQDRLLYGTDMGYRIGMYRTTFRILESEDEHFYDHVLFSYHWSLYGLGLPDGILRKVYRENALLLFDKLRNNRP